MTEAPILRLRGVSKSYDGQALAVRALDLDVARGEFLTLLGPSGSGKTTTLMMLAGFETPTAGSIELEGRRVDGLPPHRRGLGMVFQNYALFPHMTVAQNIAFPLSVRRTPQVEAMRLVAEAVELVGLSGLADRHPGQLSGGQQQRVALARALVFRPPLVLLDEPLGALDRQLRERMQIELKRLHASLGVTMIYVTHDQEEAMAMSDRVAVFHEGRVQQVAPPAELYAAPASLFVAGFVGEGNRIEGVVTAREGPVLQVAVDGLPGLVALAADAAGPGERVAIAVRPERIRLGADAHAADNRVTGRLTDLIFVGDRLRGHCALPRGRELVFKRPNDGGALPERGDMLELGWARSDARAWQVETGGSE
ncbi:MAG: ABC transporter ATP-binding protein [Roseococcus sp.]|nr:ABC transporter ATP-binding protein [Roseococcus sp.]